VHDANVAGGNGILISLLPYFTEESERRFQRDVLRSGQKNCKKRKMTTENDDAPPTLFSSNESRDGGKEGVEETMTDGRGEGGGDDEREEGGGGGGDVVERDLEYIRRSDLLAERLRWRRRRRVIVGGVAFALLVASILAIALGIASSRRRHERVGTNGVEHIFGEDDYAGQQQMQQQQQQQQQQRHESLVNINDDVVVRPLSSSMEEVYIPVLDNDSYIHVGGGPLSSLVIANITSQPNLGGECVISLDMTMVLYIPPRTAADGGSDIEPYVGASYECCYEACLAMSGGNDISGTSSSSECGVACVTIGIVDDEEGGDMGGDDGARRRR
jgi:hypothetical protein